MVVLTETQIVMKCVCVISLNSQGIPSSLSGAAGWAVAWDCLHSHCHPNRYLSQETRQMENYT